jgi:hypothetical protein
MSFIEMVFSMPTLVFTVLLAISLGWWLLMTALGIGDEIDLGGPIEGLLDAVQLGGVPPAAVLTFMSAGGWLTSIVFTSIFGDGVAVVIFIAVLLISFLVGAVFAVLLARPLGRMLETTGADSRVAFIGSMATVRTEQLDQHYGQLEITDAQGAVLLAHLAARLWQDDAHGVRRRPSRPGVREGQRAGARARGDLARSGRGA